MVYPEIIGQNLIHHMIVTNMLINEWIPMDCRRMSCIMSKEETTIALGQFTPVLGEFVGGFINIFQLSN